jgi:hypothetical protein
MAVILKAIESLLPEGEAWRIVGDEKKSIESASLNKERVKLYLENALIEADPLTATNLIDEWLDALGIKANDDATLWEKRSLANTMYTSIGGQSLDYINGVIHKSFPDVYIEENEESGELIASFTVLGFFPFSSDIVQVKSILTRIAPLHCEPIYNVRPIYDGDVARCYIGSTGRAICGRGETSYSPTDGEIAICGVCRVGLGITGREE